MVRWRTAGTLGISALVLVCAGLVGCDFVNNSSPYLAARAVDGAVEISICRDVRASSVRPLRHL